MELVQLTTTSQNDRYHEDVECKVRERERKKESIEKCMLDLRSRLHLHFELSVILKFLD